MEVYECKSKYYRISLIKLQNFYCFFKSYCVIFRFGFMRNILWYPSNLCTIMREVYRCNYYEKKITQFNFVEKTVDKLKVIFNVSSIKCG